MLEPHGVEHPPPKNNKKNNNNPFTKLSELKAGVLVVGLFSDSKSPKTTENTHTHTHTSSSVLF